MITTQTKTLADRPWLDPAATPQILIDGVSKTFDTHTAVDDVTLRIHKGEMFALRRCCACWRGSRTRRAVASRSTAWK
jgi:hypothetical protein